MHQVPRRYKLSHILIKCDAPQEKVTYAEKMNFEFSTKLDSGHPHQHVPEEYKAYCLLEPEKRAYKVRILETVLLRKLPLNFLKDIQTKKFISQERIQKLP